MISTLTDKKSIRTALVLIFWLAVWQLAAMAIGQEIFLVSPIKVIRILFHQVQEAAFWSTVAYSFVRIVGGFFLAIIIGVLLSVISAMSGTVRALLEPFFGVVKSTPVVSFIILVLIWVGNRNLSVYHFLMVLPVLIPMLGEYWRRIKTRNGQGFRMSYRKLYAIMYRTALFFCGCKLGLGLCWKSGIAAKSSGF